MNAASPAGFWIRAIAFVLDAGVLAFVQLSYGVVAALLFGVDPERSWDVSSTIVLFTIVFAALYTTVLHATGGQTVGKVLARVRVVALDGEPPAGGAAFLRWIGYAVSFGTFGLGFLMAGLRTDKRALHDLIAGTRVERVPRTRRGPPPPAPAAADEPLAPATAVPDEPRDP